MEFEGKLRQLLYQHVEGQAAVIGLLDPAFSRIQGGQVAVPATP